MSRTFLADKSAASTIEYGLLAAALALGILVTVRLIGVEVVAMFTDAAKGFSG